MTNSAKWSTIPSRSPVIKTFQNSLSFSPAKVCLLFLFGGRVFGSMLYVFSLFPPPCFGPKVLSLARSAWKNKHMSGFSQYYGLVLNFSDRNIDYLVWYTVSLVLAVSVAMDSRSLRIRFTDFNKLITMFPDEINHIPLCIWCLPVSTAQTTNSLFSESNFQSPLRTSRFKSLLVSQNFHSPWRADGWNFPALLLPYWNLKRS